MPKKRGRDFNCQVCGESFYRTPIAIKRGNTTTCGKACWSVWRLKGDYADCETCGTKFYRRRSQLTQGYGSFCSKPCWAKTRQKREAFICEVCGDTFERRPWQIARGFTRICSKPCMIIWRRGETPNIRINHFTSSQRKRWIGDKCERCCSPDKLELDHIIPRCAGGKATKKNAQTLCRRCNNKKYWLEDRPRYIEAGLLTA